MAQPCPRPPLAEMAVWNDDELDELLDDTAPLTSDARDNRPIEGEEADAS